MAGREPLHQARNQESSLSTYHGPCFFSFLTQVLFCLFLLEVAMACDSFSKGFASSPVVGVGEERCMWPELSYEIYWVMCQFGPGVDHVP